MSDAKYAVQQIHLAQVGYQSTAAKLSQLERHQAELEEKVNRGHKAEKELQQLRPVIAEKRAQLEDEKAEFLIKAREILGVEEN